MDAALNPLIAAMAEPNSDDRLIRIVSLRGFGLRDAGDGAVIDGDGTIHGSVLGGMVDAELATAAGAPTRRQALRLSVTDRDADAAGMVCGGSATVLSTPVEDLPTELRALLLRAEPVALIAATDGSGSDLVVTRKESFGGLADDVDIKIATEAGRGQLAGGGTSTDVVEVGRSSLVISTIVPRTRLRVVGAGPMAEAIAAQAALLGWTATVDESVDDAVDFLAGAGPADGVAVLSHDAAVDVPILHAALGSNVGYIGGMGSRGTQTRRRKQLSELGIADDRIDRIHGPIGLDLGSRSPQETAVAIVAEFLANRSGRNPASLRHSSGPING